MNFSFSHENYLYIKEASHNFVIINSILPLLKSDWQYFLKLLKTIICFLLS